MKTKTNWDEIESKLNFASIDQQLRELVTKGKLNRRRSVSDLLDKVKDALIAARNQGASFAALSAFLKDNGLPVSEPTLRHYVRKQNAAGRPIRRKRAVKAIKSTAAIAASSPQLTEMKHQTTASAAAPQLKARERGPRIPDPKTL